MASSYSSKESDSERHRSSNTNLQFQAIGVAVGIGAGIAFSALLLATVASGQTLDLKSNSPTANPQAGPIIEQPQKAVNPAKNISMLSKKVAPSSESVVKPSVSSSPKPVQAPVNIAPGTKTQLVPPVTKPPQPQQIQQQQQQPMMQPKVQQPVMNQPPPISQPVVIPSVTAKTSAQTSNTPIAPNPATNISTENSTKPSSSPSTSSASQPPVHKPSPVQHTKHRPPSAPSHNNNNNNNNIVNDLAPGPQQGHGHKDKHATSTENGPSFSFHGSASSSIVSSSPVLPNQQLNDGENLGIQPQDHHEGDSSSGGDDNEQ